MNMLALAIGRLVPIKDFPLLLTGWVHVDIPLHIIGDGPERDDLEGLANALRLHDRVTFLGQRDDVDQYLQKADLVIVTSRREGFGYVTLEALQHRRVVIATSTGFAAEVLPDRYLIESDPTSLAETVNWVKSNFATAQADFESTWEYAQSLTVENMTNATQSVYELLLTN